MQLGAQAGEKAIFHIEGPWLCREQFNEVQVWAHSPPLLTGSAAWWSSMSASIHSGVESVVRPVSLASLLQFYLLHSQCDYGLALFWVAFLDGA